MKQHENDLNPGPLTVSGFKGGSCCQADLSVNNLTPVKPTAEGYRGSRMQSGYGFGIWNKTMSDKTSNGRLNTELLTFAVYPDMMKLYPENVVSGFADCLVTTEFLEQPAIRQIYPEKTRITTLQADISSLMPLWGMGRVYHRETIKLSYGTVKSHFGKYVLTQPGFQICDKTSFRKRKTRWSNQLVETINRQEYSAEFATGKCKN